MRGKRFGAAAALCAAVLFSGAATSQSKHVAPGFAGPSRNATVAVMPVDIELFSISGGGVLEPRADWTEAGIRHFRAALLAKKHQLGLRGVEVSQSDADALAEVSALHAAVAGAIALHHFGKLVLPTKEGKLDWSLADAARPLKQATGADYALFSAMRDSYASGGRAVAMLGLALLGVPVAGGEQVGYASLVDLDTGQVVWFNVLARGSGDLREAGAAAETVDALLAGFPGAR